eukprot:8996725-Pyramimonas_sp.AAC.1
MLPQPSSTCLRTCHSTRPPASCPALVVAYASSRFCTDTVLMVSTTSPVTSSPWYIAVSSAEH